MKKVADEVLVEGEAVTEVGQAQERGCLNLGIGGTVQKELNFVRSNPAPPILIGKTVAIAGKCWTEL